MEQLMIFVIQISLIVMSLASIIGVLFLIYLMVKIIWEDIYN